MRVLPESVGQLTMHCMCVCVCVDVWMYVCKGEICEGVAPKKNMYVCVYVYIHTYIYICTHIHTHAKHKYTHTHTHTRAHHTAVNSDADTRAGPPQVLDTERDAESRKVTTGCVKKGTPPKDDADTCREITRKDAFLEHSRDDTLSARPVCTCVNTSVMFAPVPFMYRSVNVATPVDAVAVRPSSPARDCKRVTFAVALPIMSDAVVTLLVIKVTFISPANGTRFPPRSKRCTTGCCVKSTPSKRPLGDVASTMRVTFELGLIVRGFETATSSVGVVNMTLHCVPAVFKPTVENMATPRNGWTTALPPTRDALVMGTPNRSRDAVMARVHVSTVLL
jgi:hypothetical protein